VCCDIANCNGRDDPEGGYSTKLTVWECANTTIKGVLNGVEELHWRRVRDFWWEVGRERCKRAEDFKEVGIDGS
jgi:hypothetical protein